MVKLVTDTIVRPSYCFKSFGVQQLLTQRALKRQSQRHLRTIIAFCKTNRFTVAETAASAVNAMASVDYRCSSMHNFSLPVV